MPDGVLENRRWELVSVRGPVGYYDRSEMRIDFASGMAHVHPDDLERVLRASEPTCPAKLGENEAEGRVRHKDGSYGGYSRGAADARR